MRESRKGSQRGMRSKVISQWATGERGDDARFLMWLEHLAPGRPWSVPLQVLNTRRLRCFLSNLVNPEALSLIPTGSFHRLEIRSFYLHQEALSFMKI